MLVIIETQTVLAPWPTCQDLHFELYWSSWQVTFNEVEIKHWLSQEQMYKIPWKIRQKWTMAANPRETKREDICLTYSMAVTASWELKVGLALTRISSPSVCPSQGFVLSPGRIVLTHSCQGPVNQSRKMSVLTAIMHNELTILYGSTIYRA